MKNNLNRQVPDLLISLPSLEFRHQRGFLLRNNDAGINSTPYLRLAHLIDREPNEKAAWDCRSNQALKSHNEFTAQHTTRRASAIKVKSSCALPLS